jgi:hypothetical protein
MKTCCNCNETKSYFEFFKNKSNKDGYEYRCKLCKKSQRAKNSQEVDKLYYQKNKEKIISRNRIYEINNQKKVKENHRLYMRKRRLDPKFKLQQSIKALINFHLKEKTKRTNEYLGCSYEEYSLYLENKFTDNMNWENYGIYWEIDHTIPLSKGGSFHYTNTTPMTISANRSKSNKL